MADCNKCPLQRECALINTNLRRDKKVLEPYTFCPLKYAAETATNNKFKEAEKHD